MDMEFDCFSLLFDALFVEEANLLEVEDKVSNVSDYTGDRSKFMINTTDLDRADGIAFEAAKQYATNRVAYRDSIPRLEWAKLKDTFTLSGLMKFNIAMNLMII